MAAAEEEERQKRLKALKEKNDMLIAIKERKAEGQLLKYYAHEKYREHVKEWDAAAGYRFTGLARRSASPTFSRCCLPPCQRESRSTRRRRMTVRSLVATSRSTCFVKA